MKDYEFFYPDFVNPYTTGRPLAYKPKELAEKFAEYLQWAKEHPIANIYETTGINQQGDAFGNTNKNVKPRLISVGGFLVFIGRSRQWWSDLSTGKRGEEFSDIKNKITDYCENYQKEMASAGIFKENIISRLLGLTDKKEVTANGDQLTIVVNTPDEKEKISNLGNLGV